MRSWRAPAASVALAVLLMWLGGSSPWGLGASEAAEFRLAPPAMSGPAPDVAFSDAQGRSLTFADFRGKIVLVNFWATWCPPCLREMPTLDRLQAELGGPDFEVVAVSVDRGGVPQVKAFYERLSLANLKIYVDPTLRSTRDLRVVGLPTTVLLDRRGNELGRMTGPAEWDSPEVVAFLEGTIAGSLDLGAAEGDVPRPAALLPSPTRGLANRYGAALIGAGALVLFGVYVLMRRRAARVGGRPKEERSSAPADERLASPSDPHGS